MSAPFKDLFLAGPKRKLTSLRVSLRYKLAFPVIAFVSLMIFFLFNTTFSLVRTLVIGGVEERLKALTLVFAEAVKDPMLANNRAEINEILTWMERQSNVSLVRLADWQGEIVLELSENVQLPDDVKSQNFLGIRRISADEFVVAVFVQARDQLLGRLVVVYSRLGVESQLKLIFQERLLFAFLMLLILSLMVMGIAWFAVRPLFSLEKAVKRILSGDLDARASIRSFDEIEDVSEAFDEMVSRLTKSLDRLRLRTEALEESEEKYRLVIENASDIIFTLTSEGELVLLNRGFSGCTREEFLHEGLALILSLHSPETRHQFQQALEDVMRKQASVHNLSVSHIAKGTKSEIFYLVNLTPVLGHEEEVKLIQGVMRDVTELRRIEMMKDSLIRDVAHELKTPVAKFSMAITWFEKEMMKLAEKEKYGEILKILKNNVNRLMQTIASIMDLSKLEAGVEQITKVPLDLNEVLAEVSRDMKPLIEQKKLAFECHLRPKPLMMEGDAHMLYRLFSNLLQNAIKFTDVGKIILESALDEGEIRVKVRDTGCGLAEGDVEVIFDRFVQKTAASLGIGVGLTICRDIAALHEGKIWAESPGEGKGSTFHVVFPII